MTPSTNLLAPVWNATISSPVTLAGTGVAYEGTIQAQVRQDDTAKSLGESYVTGAGAAIGPFQRDPRVHESGAGYRAAVLYTTSAEDGTVMAGSAIRVEFS